MLVVSDSSKDPPMLVNMPMLDTPGAGGELVKPPKAKGSVKNTGGKKGRGSSSKPPPACFAAFSKMVTPAAAR